jgi:hypothetical protein
MSDVFLSYAHADRDFAAGLASRLQAAGVEAWWDDHLPEGDLYRDEIAQHLHEAKLVVVLWSEAAIASGWVAAEALEARNSGRLLSISIDGSIPPIGFRQFQFVALEPGDEAALDRLAAMIARGLTDQAGRVRQREHRGFVMVDFAARYRLPAWKLIAGSLAVMAVAWALIFLQSVLFEFKEFPLSPATSVLPFFTLLAGRALLPDPQGASRSSPQRFFAGHACMVWLACFAFASLVDGGLRLASGAKLADSLAHWAGATFLGGPLYATLVFVLPACVLRLAHGLGWYAAHGRVTRQS